MMPTLGWGLLSIARKNSHVSFRMPQKVKGEVAAVNGISTNSERLTIVQSTLSQPASVSDTDAMRKNG
ncbi:Arc family DNA-binding protein [Serratia marcescens]|uniref:Arc family DNA-binding protein n=1 Tax=Serratia marcescens TaxID=615 RepID=UPI003AFAB3E9